MTVVGVLWGTIGPAAAIVQDHAALNPLQTSFWRLAIAVLPLLLLASLATRSATAVKGRVLLLGAGIGVLTGASQLAYFGAVASAGIAIPTLISNGLGPVLTALGQTVVFGQAPNRSTLAALAGALVGLTFLVADQPGQLTTTGVLLALAAAATFAGYSLAAGPASRRMEIRTLNAAAAIGGVTAMLPPVLLSGGPGLPNSGLGWIVLFHMGLIVTGLTYALYFRASRRLSSTHLTILMLLEPVVGTIIAVFAFGEQLTPGTVVGGLLMLGAVATLRPDHTEPPLQSSVVSEPTIL